MFFFSSHGPPRDLHSFPTRRSSDLYPSRLRLLEADRPPAAGPAGPAAGDRKSTRLNSSHTVISYAVFCLKKKRWWELPRLPPRTYLRREERRERATDRDRSEHAGED